MRTIRLGLNVFGLESWPELLTQKYIRLQTIAVITFVAFS